MTLNDIVDDAGLRKPFWMAFWMTDDVGRRWMTYWMTFWMTGDVLDDVLIDG